MELIDSKQPLPNATATLVLGIISVVIGCLPVGLVCGIIALVISKEGKLLYEQNPMAYSGYGNLNAGRVLGIIGIVLGGISLLYFLSIIALGGAILGGIMGLSGL